MSKTLEEYEAELRKAKDAVSAAQAVVHAVGAALCVQYAPFKRGDRVKITTKSSRNGGRELVRHGVVEHVTYRGRESCIGIGGFDYTVRQVSKTGRPGACINVWSGTEMEKE